MRVTHKYVKRKIKLATALCKQLDIPELHSSEKLISPPFWIGVK